MKTSFENRQIRHLPPDVSFLSDAAGNAGSQQSAPALTLILTTPDPITTFPRFIAKNSRSR